ncbi:MAG: response regulator [Elainellaceae cyanobacterium]
MAQSALPTLLLVEDSASDANLFMRYVRKSQLIHDIAWVETGEDALMYLRQEGGYAQAMRPSLIVLDLNLPRLDGQDVLSSIKADLALRQIPVIVLTSSDSEDDIFQAYDRYANCYLQKPQEAQNYTSTLNAIEEFWLNFAVLPSRRFAG